VVYLRVYHGGYTPELVYLRVYYGGYPMGGVYLRVYYGRYTQGVREGVYNGGYTQGVKRGTMRRIELPFFGRLGEYEAHRALLRA